ncbi:allophanate hydrolase-related protein [Cobetia crustatorum]
MELEDGRWVAGFICSVSADCDVPMTDISEYGGWKAWVEQK